MPTINRQKRRQVKRPTQDYSILYNNKWTTLRNAYMMNHPLCEMCLKEGKTVAAEEIHHIRPISTGKDMLEMKFLAYDYGNLMALCKECHHKIHNRMRNSTINHF